MTGNRRAGQQRERVLGLLREATQPVGVQHIADSLGIHITTVRFHLRTLEEQGHIVRRSGGAGQRAGRPSLAYAVAPRLDYADVVSLFAVHLGGTAAERESRAALVGADWADGRRGHLLVVAGAAANVTPSDAWAVPGAIIASVTGAVLIEVIRAKGRTRGDVALAILFYGGIAGGVILIKVAGGTTTNLTSYLFGSIATVSVSDAWFTIVLSVLVLVVGIGLRGPLFSLCHDEEFARSIGLPTGVLNVTIAVVAALTFAKVSLHQYGAQGQVAVMNLNEAIEHAEQAFGYLRSRVATYRAFREGFHRKAAESDLRGPELPNWTGDDHFEAAYVAGGIAAYWNYLTRAEPDLVELGKAPFDTDAARRTFSDADRVTDCRPLDHPETIA
mgnify:CR=1 FL=1